MKKERNQQKEAGELIELVREIIRQESSTKDSTAICIVESVNANGTLNLFVLPDKQTSIKNITNQCRFDFKAGDTALLYLIGNRLSNSFVIAKYNAIPVITQKTKNNLKTTQLDTELNFVLSNGDYYIMNDDNYFYIEEDI